MHFNSRKLRPLWLTQRWAACKTALPCAFPMRKTRKLMKRHITLTICSLLASWSATAEPVQPSQTDALPASQPYAVYAQLGASPHAAHS